jgi:protein gp37
MLLTKRIERVPECLPADWPLDNVELGVSVETADFLWRIDQLREIEATRIYISAEPLLSKFSARAYLGDPYPGRPLDGVIAGGESGSGYRVMEDDAARLLREECRETDTAFFFKQHSGSRPGLEPYLDGCLYHALPGEGFKEVVLDE